MHKKQGYYVDKNNNKWDATLFSEEQARCYSDTMRYCMNCMNCKDCSDCMNCMNCTDCVSCANCKNCTDCTDCKNCAGCENCTYCTDCTDCTDCTYCKNCAGCKNCTYCKNCADCKNCANCANCKNCTDCMKCKEFKSNPHRVVVSNIGSRNGTTSIYFYCDTTIVVCGCFLGTLLEFEKAVIQKHGSNEYAIRYLDLINKVWGIMEV